MEELWNMKNANYADVVGLTKYEERDSQLDEKIEALQQQITDQCPDIKEKLYKLMRLCSEKSRVQNKIGFWLGNKYGYEVYENNVVHNKKSPAQTPSKVFFPRCLAYITTRLTYRNTDDLEELHVQNKIKTPDMSFFNQMLENVRTLFDKYYPHVKSLLSDEPPSNQLEIDLQEYLRYLICEMKEWDTPHLKQAPFSGDVAEFVLSGAFKTACEKNQPLTDDKMHVLNKDVYNRFYTLVLKGII